MFMTMESTCALGFHSGSYSCSRNHSASYGSQRIWGCSRPSWYIGHRFLCRRPLDLRVPCMGGCSGPSRSNLFSASSTGSLPEHAGSLPEPIEDSHRPHHHPFENVEEDRPLGIADDARLTDAEAARTTIEVNRRATIMFSGMIDNTTHEKIFVSDLPYLADEHGDIYFEVDPDEDILQTLASDNRLMQVMIGLDNLEMLPDIDACGLTEYQFGLEEITIKDNDVDDDYEEDLIAILEDENGMISSEEFGDWANLDTMGASHPLHFASKIAEVVSNVHLDWMDQPSAIVVVQGLLRPAFVEEQKFVSEHPSGCTTDYAAKHHHGKILEDNVNEEQEKDPSLQRGTVFYKLEMINIQLVSAYGNQSVVRVEDFQKARPDVIARSATKIISRLKAGGEKTMQALKALCCRHKGIKVEEVVISGVDSLGFDLRVCSGIQVQTLRFSFSKQATSEYSAERQLHDLLFPRLQCKQQVPRQIHNKEC